MASVPGDPASERPGRAQGDGLGKNYGPSKVRVRVEARKARRRSDSRYPFLDLDFVNDEPASPRARVLYGLAALVCVLGALVGAVLPVIPAIPLWIMAAIFASHAFPAFGRWLCNTRLYRWLISKLNEPQKEATRPCMKRSHKDRIMICTTVLMGLVLLVCALRPIPLPIELPHGYMWYVSAAISVLWVALWFYLYFYVREPEATIRSSRKVPRSRNPGSRRRPGSGGRPGSGRPGGEQR